MFSNLRISMRRKKLNNKKKTMNELDLQPLSPLLTKIAEAELGEDPKRVPEDIEALRTWLEKEAHLKARQDDQFLISFLRGSKYSLEKSKEKIDTYYTFRAACPEIYAIRDPLDSKFQYILNQGVILCIPELHPDGRRILIQRPFFFDSTKYTIIDVLNITFTLGDIMLYDDSSIIAGQTHLIDLKGLALSNSTQVTPTLLKKIATAIAGAYPHRFKGLHFINAPGVFEMIYKIFSQLINEKMKKRLMIHSNLESVYKHIPKSLLPKEYGGDTFTIDMLKESTKSYVLSHREWILDDMKYGSDESKRIGKSKNADLLFGAEGSFRQLEFD